MFSFQVQKFHFYILILNEDTSKAIKMSKLTWFQSILSLNILLHIMRRLICAFLTSFHPFKHSISVALYSGPTSCSYSPIHSKVCTREARHGPEENIQSNIQGECQSKKKGLNLNTNFKMSGDKRKMKRCQVSSISFFFTFFLSLSGTNLGKKGIKRSLKTSLLLWQRHDRRGALLSRLD